MRNRLLIILSVVSIGAVGYWAGLTEYLDPDDLGELIDGWGAWGPLMVVVLGLIVGFIVYALFVPLVKLLNELS